MRKLKELQYQLLANVLKVMDQSVWKKEEGDGFMTFIIVILVVIALGALIYTGFKDFFENTLIPWIINQLKTTFGIN